MPAPASVRSGERLRFSCGGLHLAKYEAARRLSRSTAEAKYSRRDAMRVGHFDRQLGCRASEKHAVGCKRKLDHGCSECAVSLRDYVRAEAVPGPVGLGDPMCGAVA